MTIQVPVAQALEELRKIMAATNFGASDVFAYLAQLSAQHPSVCTAFMLHVSDAYAENPECTPIDAFCLGHSRTFFDPEAAEKYGTSHLVLGSVEAQVSYIRQMGEGMKGYHAADDKQQYFSIFEAGKDGSAAH